VTTGMINDIGYNPKGEREVNNLESV